MKHILTEPLSILIAGLIIFALFFTRRRKFALAVLFSSIFATLLFSLPVVSSRLLKFVEVGGSINERPSNIDPQAIVVLSAGLNSVSPEYGGPSLDSLSLVRVRYGAYLHNKTKLPILVSGGTWMHSKRSLADHMARVLRREFQVPVKWLEETSGNTFENARESKRILAANNISAIYLVTHAFHMRRAREAFEKQGLKVAAAPTGFVYVDDTPNFGHFIPQSFALGQSRYAISETLGRLWYHIRYYNR